MNIDHIKGQITNGFDVGQIKAFAGAVASDCLLCDGSAKSRTTYANLFNYLVTALGFTGQTFTVTIATPAVFTMTAHGFTGGERIRLSTTGALPTGLINLIDYYVIYVSVNTFQVSTTFGGAAVATSGTQSGTHSYMQSLYGLGDGSTTFNVPDYRGQFLRGLDAGAGFDAGRTLGSTQKGTLIASDLNFSDGTYWSQSTAVTSTANPLQTIGLDAVNTNAYSGSLILNATPYSSATIASGSNVGTSRPINAAINYGIKY
jgi:microcystin-dependent protein